MERMNKYTLIAVTAAVIVLGGITGWAAMKKLAAGYMHGGRLYLIASAPSADIVEVLQASVSNDQYRRAAAWYTLLEYRLVDPETVKETYKLESQPYMKKIMLYVLKNFDINQWRAFTGTLPADEVPKPVPDRRAILSYTM